jgi:hypothetical protein
VVYIGDSGSAYDLFHYDITTSTTTQLTSSGSRWCTMITDFNDPCVALQVSDKWWGGPPPPPIFTDVDLWDGTMIRTLNPCTFNLAPRVSNQWVAWQGTGPSAAQDIFLYNINLSTSTQLTKSPTAPYWYHYDPQLSGGYLAWWGTEFAQTKIYFSKLTSVTPSYSDIATSISVQQPWVVISGPHVFYAWTDDIFGYGVFHYDFTQRPPVTTQIYPVAPPPPPPIWTCDSMHACTSHVIFATHDPGGPNYQVYLWDITTGGPLRQITAKGSSLGPVYVRVYSRPFPPYGYVPVAVWEENLGGPTTKAFMSTQPICASIPVGDFNRDCLVNQVDYAYMASYWMKQWPPGAGPIPSPDLNGDNKVDWTDIGILRSNWLKCNIQPPIHCGCGCIFP